MARTLLHQLKLPSGQPSSGEHEQAQPLEIAPAKAASGGSLEQAVQEEQTWEEAERWLLDSGPQAHGEELAHWAGATVNLMLSTADGNLPYVVPCAITHTVSSSTSGGLLMANGRMAAALTNLKSTFLDSRWDC